MMDDPTPIEAKMNFARLGDELLKAEIAKEPQFKRREVIGDCTLYLGDCLEVMPGLGEFDAVVTDPPYGIGFSGQARIFKRKRLQWRVANLSRRKGLGQIRAEMRQCLTRFAIAAASQIIWGGNYFADKHAGGAWLVGMG